MGSALNIVSNTTPEPIPAEVTGTLAISELGAQGFTPGKVGVTFFMNLRYLGQ